MPRSRRQVVFVSEAPGAGKTSLAWSRKLGATAMELLWALAADAPSALGEANFRPPDRYQREKLSALAGRPASPAPADGLWSVKNVWPDETKNTTVGS